MIKSRPAIAKIIIINFGSQYTQLICRRLRELNILAEVVSKDYQLIDNSVLGIILSGGPCSATDTSIEVPDWVWQSGLPVLGICYGMQAMVKVFGGRVDSGHAREFGLSKVMLQEQATIAIPSGSNVWMSHSDHVQTIPGDFLVAARNQDGTIVAVENTSKHYYGVQFHPEVTHTEYGKELLFWFANSVCACPQDWQEQDIAKDILAAVQDQVQDEKVLLAVSGGVDSTVLANLLKQSLGDNFTAVFIDNGLLRKNEVEQVKCMFAAMGIKLDAIDAKSEFYTALSGVTEPEQKRKIIGKTFIDVFESYTKDKHDFKWLAQGTIYSDVIESAGKSNDSADVIKSHHNVGGLPADMQFKLLEPLAYLFKDEVRSLGRFLGLSDKVLLRHPFPGPGLAVRILGEVTAEKVALLQEADAIFMDCLADIYNDISQAFAVLLPVKSVGVVGDQRSYGFVLALRAVVTTDFMTGKAAHIPYDILCMASRKIVNSLPQISRVVYDITDKPPSTIEWE